MSKSDAESYLRDKLKRASNALNEFVSRQKLRDGHKSAQQNEEIARGGKQQSCVKPHICFKRGRWQMDGWYEGNLPHIAYCHADWATAREYFRSVLRCR